MHFPVMMAPLEIETPGYTMTSGPSVTFTA